MEAPNVTFGQNVTLYEGVHIWGGGRILIGDNVAIGKDTIIYAAELISIGNDVLIAAQSYLIDCDHGIARDQLIRTQPLISQPIQIGNDVWIGAGAKVLKGSVLGDGVIVGAQSVVRGVLEPYSIHVGVPVRKVGERTASP